MANPVRSFGEGEMDGGDPPRAKICSQSDRLLCCLRRAGPVHILGKQALTLAPLLRLVPSGSRKVNSSTILCTRRSSTGFPSCRAMPKKPLMTSLRVSRRIHCQKRRSVDAVLPPGSVRHRHIRPRRGLQIFRPLCGHQFAKRQPRLAFAAGTTG